MVIEKQAVVVLLHYVVVAVNGFSLCVVHFMALTKL